MRGAKSLEPLPGPLAFFVGFASEKHDSLERLQLVKETFAAGAVFEGPMPGKSAAECGNYINLDVELAKRQCAVVIHLKTGNPFHIRTPFINGTYSPSLSALAKGNNAEEYFNYPEAMAKLNAVVLPFARALRDGE